MKNVVIPRLALLLLCYFSVAGACAQSISGVINSYYRVTAVNTSLNRLTVSNAAGLIPGLKVLIIQMKGAAIDNTNTSSFGDVTSIGQAGSYEYNTICAVAGNNILLKTEFIHPYDSAGSVQLIPVPQYNVITVTDTVKASPWSLASGTGGVVVMEADTLYLNSAISVTGQGFAGGAFVNFTMPTYDCSWAVNVTNYFLALAPSPNQYYSGGPKGEGVAEFIANAEYGRGKQANGGGGGNNHNTGGAGGANFGSGGNGGNRSNEGFFLCHGTNPGVGGLALSSYGYSTANNKIFMGGGGGSGHQNNAKGTPGGNGGGIVFIKANVLIGSGTSILADGLSPVNLTNVDPYIAEGDGGGGGGAGGSIILDLTEVIGSVDATARGARGSDASRAVSDCLGPGGGGGGGAVWTNGASVPAGVNVVVTAGGNGVISALSSGGCAGQTNGATPGSVGSAITGYVPPVGANVLCVPLAITELQFFKGRAGQDVNSLWWTMNSISTISSYEIERSVDQVSFSTIARFVNNGNYSFSIDDHDNPSGTTFYRLKIIRRNGSASYSAIISIIRNIDGVLSQLHIFPNPATDQLKVSTLLKKAASVQISIFNVSGQRVFDSRMRFPAGYTTIPVTSSQLANGIYWIVVEAEGLKHRRKFIKSN